MGPQLPATVLGLMTECANADMGILLEREVALGLAYKPREYLYCQSAALALTYTNSELAKVPVPVDDDRYTRNDIIATRVNGSSARVALDEGPMSTQPPPLGVGPYDDGASVNVSADNVLPYQAGWRVHLGTVDEARFPQLSINLSHPKIAGTSLRSDALGILPGARVTVAGMPSWTQPDDVSQIVLGIQESINHFKHEMTFNCAPESPYRVATTDDTVLGHVDTDGSRLAADVDTTTTSVSVEVYDGPLWTTDAGEFPFDLSIGGEVMTCTAISGVSSPQTFAVTRSVNGVVKAQTSGTDVRLAHPAIVAL
jgi:hypothetical protein